MSISEIFIEGDRDRGVICIRFMLARLHMLMLVLEIGIPVMSVILSYSLKLECLAGCLEKILWCPFSCITLGLDIICKQKFMFGFIVSVAPDCGNFNVKLYFSGCCFFFASSSSGLSPDGLVMLNYAYDVQCIGLF
jgi:hypothetical protein